MSAPSFIPEAGIEEDALALPTNANKVGFFDFDSARASSIARRAIEATGNGEFTVFLELLLSDYCRAAKPSFASAYRRAAAMSKHKKQAVPSQSTARRILRAIATQTEGAK